MLWFANSGSPRSGALAILMVSSTAFTAPAFAQDIAPPTLPGQTREEINRIPTGPSVQAPSRLTVEGGVERAPCPLADPRFADIKVTITGAEFNGLRVVSPEALRPAYESYIGQNVPIAAVCEIRDAAATILRRQGYLAAVQVPPQQIDNGIVKFDVLMGKIVAIQVRGDAGKSERLIAGYLEQLKSQEAFNERDAERYLLLARDLPGYDVRLTLKPAGTTPGDLVGEVSVVKTPFVIDANVQNYGSHGVGRWGGLLRAEIYDVLGSGDRLTAGFFATPQFSEQHVVQLGYDTRIGSEGLTFSSRFAYAWSKPDINQANITLKSKTLIAGGEFSYPFLRTQSTNLRGAIGLEYVDQRTRFNDAPLSRDRLSIAYARLDFDALDRASISSTVGYSANEPRWRVAGSLEARQGLDILGASDDCGPTPFVKCLANGAVPPARIAGDATAFVLRASGVAEWRPAPLVTLSIAPRAQYSNAPLFSYERYSAGSYTIGRGYDPGTLVGDRGVGFQAELRYGSLMPKSRTAFSFQPYVFLDKVWTWSERDARNPLLGSDPQQLTTTGIGFRSAYGDHARIDVTLAVPVDKTRGIPAPKQRLMISLTTRLWPWNR